jgi:P4 family phage/plasmid primase-like protien
MDRLGELAIRSSPEKLKELGLRIIKKAPDSEDGDGDASGLLLANNTGGQAVAPDNSAKSFCKTAAHVRWTGDYRNALTNVEFCSAVANEAKSGFCYKLGQGLMRYEEQNGTWVEDIKESRLLNFILNAGDIYREFWLNSEKLGDYPSIAKLCRKLESSTFIRTEVKPMILDMLTQSAGIFDAAPYFINCRGIAVDLRTGKKRPARKEDYFTKSTAFNPGDPDSAVRFRQFLLEVCGGNKSKAAWVLRWFCRAAVGTNLDSLILNLEGDGGNGKSVIQNLFLKVYGSYGMVVPQELIIKEGGVGEAARAFHGLEGVRYGTLADCGRGTLRLAELKRLTGGDVLTSRALYQESVMFTSVISLVIGSNMPLRLTEMGEAIQRRLKNVKFDWKGKADPLLMERLLAEGEAITAIIIKECGKYLANRAAGGTGFPPCEAIERHAREHIEAQNPVKQFLIEQPEMITSKIACGAVWNAYQNFARDFGEAFPKKREFNAGMENEGYYDVYRGIWCATKSRARNKNSALFK